MSVDIAGYLSNQQPSQVVAGASGANGSLVAGQKNLASSYETFLTLLTTQLKNQDPTAPLDTNAFTQQLVQMTGVQQQLLSNQLLQSLVNQGQGGLTEGVGLIGKTVTAQTPSANLDGGSAKWIYDLDTAATAATLSISDANGRIVWSGAAPERGAGEHDFTWNGKDTLEIDFLKSDVPNEWYAEIRAVPATDVQVGAPLVNGQLAVGTVPFTPGGKLDKNWVAGPGQTALFADWDAPVLDFAASGSAAPAASAIKWDTALGIDDQQIEVQLGMLPGGITQFDSTSVTQSIQADGTAFGNLTNIDINDNGFVTANFDNGVSRQIAQIALATFSNPDGLRAQSGNAYRVSLDSGTFNLKPPGSGGAGILSPSTLEASTVDLSSEFTGLITTQRAYSASAKIITTADQMLEELINIKR